MAASQGRIFRKIILLLAIIGTGGVVERVKALFDPLLYPMVYKSRRVNLTQVANLFTVGDISMARGIGNEAAFYGAAWPLESVTDLLKMADVSAGNYEGVLANAGVGIERTGGWRLRADPVIAGALYQAGFRVLGVANNHSLDWGPDGLRSTVAAFQHADIQVVGGGLGRAAALEPVVTTVGDIRVVWAALYGVADPVLDDSTTWSRAWLEQQPDRQQLSQWVAGLRSRGDVVIVMVHWGVEYESCPSAWQIMMGRFLIDSGVDLVIGSHPHVAESIETYKHGMIAYSLGNFLFDQPEHMALALWIRVDAAGVVDVHAVGLRSGWRPYWLDPTDSAKAVAGLCRTPPAT